jgi:hypothetical protein
MTTDLPSSTRPRPDGDALDQTDRILLGVAAGSWLAALGAGVAAVVALSHMGGSSSGGGQGETPWLLYTVIGVSAVVIIAAVPLLIRARRSAGDPTGAPAPAATPRIVKPGAAFGDPVATTNVRATGGPVIRRQSVPPPPSSRVGFPTAAVERIYLRCPAVITAVMGGATTLVGVGTYLAATEHPTPSWVVYGFAGLLVLAMPAAPVFFLRQLRQVLA